MKLSYTTRNGRMTVELEADTQTQLFKELALFQRTFEDTTCTDGKETSDVVNFVVQEDEEGNFYHFLQCMDEKKPNLRFAKKRFGQNKGKEGTLFPKSDWAKWDKDKNAEVSLRTGQVLVKDKKDE